jgi:hypothetical protein
VRGPLTDIAIAGSGLTTLTIKVHTEKTQHPSRHHALSLSSDSPEVDEDCSSCSVVASKRERQWR